MKLEQFLDEVTPTPVVSIRPEDYYTVLIERSGAADGGKLKMSEIKALALKAEIRDAVESGDSGALVDVLIEIVDWMVEFEDELRGDVGL